MPADLTLTREKSTSAGTFGVIEGYEGIRLHTLELPWKNNQQKRSCIPHGTYTCVWSHSPKFGEVYEVTGVPGRSHVLIHAGNFAGDLQQGLKSDVEGCILLGLGRGVINGQAAVLQSKPALAMFNKEMGQKPFTLEIKGE